jgi:hypothetical protein
LNSLELTNSSYFFIILFDSLIKYVTKKLPHLQA